MSSSFSWKSIWKIKVPLRVAFFSWNAALGKILTIDNLRLRKVLVLDWCYMCKRVGETVDHLLSFTSSLCLHLRDVVFCILFGVFWVMPSRVIDLLACWRGGFAWKVLSVIWNAFPLCVRWMLRWERNCRDFEDSKRSSVELKMIFVRPLCDWMDALSGHSFSYALDFVDLCFPC